ncbi:N-acetyltransferase family protein [Dethiothermospora halolimnae]|uniref:GNAT family N-acetyltransferase n=1 Tax=Dethiothermospora halolimnae TaxID=3114390 RepID=UPI003CCB79B1
MEVRFRDIKKEDINQVVDFFKELHHEKAEVSFSEVEKKEEIEQWIDEPRMCLYVAEEDGKILGVFRGKRGKEGRNHSCFLTAAVSKKCRGQKIGQRLTNYSLDRLKEEGVKIARAYVYSNNPSSVSTLLKCGFTSSGCVHMHHFDEKTNGYVDDLIFHKILK